MRKLNTKALVPLIGTSPFHANHHITRCMSGPDCGPLKPSDKYLHSVYMYKGVSLNIVHDGGAKSLSDSTQYIG